MELLVGKNLSTFNSRKIPKAFLLSVLIILVINAIELFIFPINAFTFRVWESVIVNHPYSNLPGPFYPNMTIAMIEEGDLGHHTPLAVKKNVAWETDKYGYRKRNENITRYDIVIIGDSDIAGSGLTQSDMFSEQLEKRLDAKVYPLAPADINTFLSSSKFKNNPPKVVILESIERSLPSLPSIQRNLNHPSKSLKTNHVQEKHSKKNASLAILCDRLSKQIMARYLLKIIPRTFEKITNALKKLSAALSVGTIGKSQTRMLCLDNKNNNISLEKQEKIIERIIAYEEILSAHGIHFIFFPIPDKKTIYWKELSLSEKPTFLKQITNKLRKAGIEILDVEDTFKKAAANNDALLYHLDDSHWNPNGVKLSVDLAVKLLEKYQ